MGEFLVSMQECHRKDKYMKSVIQLISVEPLFVLHLVIVQDCTITKWKTKRSKALLIGPFCGKLSFFLTPVIA